MLKALLLPVAVLLLGLAHFSGRFAPFMVVVACILAGFVAASTTTARTAPVGRWALSTRCWTTPNRWRWS
jgi:hypothetical protein